MKVQCELSIRESRGGNILNLKLMVLRTMVEEDQGMFEERFAKEVEFFDDLLHEHVVDMCVTYGGDGTILFTANKF